MLYVLPCILIMERIYKEKTMELRVLEYFIAIVEHQSITQAAKSLFISQSTLSRQIMDLEKNLGVVLFERGRRKISLTEDGYFLYQRAKEIVQLAQATENDLLSGQSISGTLHIGTGEGGANRLILTAAKNLIANNSDVNLDYQTLNADKIFQAVDKGTLDFGVIWTNNNLSDFNSLELPFENYWGVLVNKNDPLAIKTKIVANDLRQRQLIIPQQLDVKSELLQYLKQYVPGVQITGYYDMNYNMLALVKNKIGVALTLNKPEYNSSNNFKFIPIPFLKKIGVKLVWKKVRKQSRLATAFLNQIKSQIK